MTIISASEKFDGSQAQACVLAGGYVILRAVLRQQDLAVMTATARESGPTTTALPYPDQETLIATAEQVFHEVGGIVTNRKDRHGRPYVQTVFQDAWTTLSNIAKRLAERLELDDVQIVQDDVLADLWVDLAVDPLDEDELVYLSDGMYITKGGGLTEQ